MTILTLTLAGYAEIGLPPVGSLPCPCVDTGINVRNTPCPRVADSIHELEIDDFQPPLRAPYEWRCGSHAEGCFASVLEVEGLFTRGGGLYQR